MVFMRLEFLFVRVVWDVYDAVCLFGLITFSVRWVL